VLDEVGELPLPIQAKLLRALQEGEIQPVGAARVENVDVRVVACTNRDLDADAKQGKFRADLFYRLAVVDLVVPPLRSHREDIPALVAEFARRYGERYGVPDVRVSPALVELMRTANWPGNVRQLENTVARMVALSTNGELGPELLTTDPGPEVAQDGARAGPLSLRQYLDAVERNFIASAIEASGGNQSEAARQLGMGRGALIERLKKYGLA
jgi:two-component system response regulator AtoC